MKWIGWAVRLILGAVAAWAVTSLVLVANGWIVLALMLAVFVFGFDFGALNMLNKVEKWIKEDDIEQDI